MRSIGSQHDPAALGPHAHNLQTTRVAADPVDAQSRRKLTRAVVKLNPAFKNPPHHRRYIVDFKRMAQQLLAHASTGAVLNFLVLQVVTCTREQIVIAAMVIMHMRHDYVFDGREIYADRLEPFADGPDDFAVTLLGHRRVESGVDNDSSVIADHSPNEEIQWHRSIMRIAADKILRSSAVRDLTVPYRIDCIIRHTASLMPPVGISHFLAHG
jgi:hypothetical protein